MTETSGAAPSVSASPDKKQKKGCATFILIFWIVLIGGGIVWYMISSKMFSRLALPFTTPKNEVAAVVSSVGKLMQLPNEDATLATVSDKTKLSSQPFFAHAENGDKVLIYAKSKKAILYRPSINKIIEVGPITINTEGQQTSSITAPAPTGAASPSATIAPRKP